MKHLLPHGSSSDQTSAWQRLQNLPFRQWTANIVSYLRSAPWQLWGFILIATFGYIVYLWLSFWLGILGFFIIAFISMTFHMERASSAAEQGVFYWIERSLNEIIFQNLSERRQEKLRKSARRFSAFGFVRCLIDLAIALARPNRFTFLLGCTGLALVAIGFVQSHLHPHAADPSASYLSTPDAANFERLPEDYD